MADGFSTRRRVMPRMRGIVCGVRLDRGGKAFARTHALCAGNAIGEHDLVACAAQGERGRRRRSALLLPAHRFRAAPKVSATTMGTTRRVCSGSNDMRRPWCALARQAMARKGSPFS